MAGIYIHIPFCKQACHYCDFHFSTTRKHQEKMVDAICSELRLRAKEAKQTIKTIYFGGGTPSLLTGAQFDKIFRVIYDHYLVEKEPEITLEANPDDLTLDYIKLLAARPFNRLSIGVQSFLERDLVFMNRAHNVSQAFESIENVRKYFDNISIDLIYGVPNMSREDWLYNLEQSFELNVPHLSCYALTMEPKTAMASFIEKGIISPLDDLQAGEHYQLLLEKTQEQGYLNYEFSNFGKPDYFSKNNTAYWQGKTYLGIGPGAHSFDGATRSWNLANNPKYIMALEAGERPFTSEELSKTDRYNERIMTGLRTMWGVSLPEIIEQFGTDYLDYLKQQAIPLEKDGLVVFKEHSLHVSEKGKFLTDGIAADLFRVF